MNQKRVALKKKNDILTYIIIVTGINSLSSVKNDYCDCCFLRCSQRTQCLLNLKKKMWQKLFQPFEFDDMIPMHVFTEIDTLAD